MTHCKKKLQKKQPKKHKYRELLTHLQCCTKAPLSYKEQSQIVECSERLAKMVTKENLEAGVITKTPTIYKSRGRTLTGKNIYGRGKNFDPKLHLIDDLDLSITKDLKNNLVCEFVPRQVSKNGSYKNFTPKKNFLRNLDKSKFAKASAGYFYSSYEEFLEKSGRKAIFEKYGFTHQVAKAPNWWFKDLSRLESALRLLKSKIKHGFKPKNFHKFITYLLKRGVFGWFRHRARELSVAVVQPNIKNTLKFCMSEPIEKTYLGMKELYAKHNLNLSFKSVEKLLRNKFPRLTAAVSVCLTRISWASGDEIRDANAFLNYLVGMNNPFDYLKNKNGYI